MPRNSSNIPDMAVGPPRVCIRIVVPSRRQRLAHTSPRKFLHPDLGKQRNQMMIRSIFCAS